MTPPARVPLRLCALSFPGLNISCPLATRTTTTPHSVHRAVTFPWLGRSQRLIRHLLPQESSVIQRRTNVKEGEGEQHSAERNVEQMPQRQQSATPATPRFRRA